MNNSTPRSVFRAFVPILVYLAVMVPIMLIQVLSVLVTLMLQGKSLHLSQEIFLESAPVFNIISNLAILPVFLYMYTGDRKRRVAGGIQGFPFRFLLPVALTGLAACFLGNLLLPYLTKLFPQAYDEMRVGIYDGPIYLQVINIVVLPPMVEELMFRGLIYGRLRERLKVPSAVLVSALIFALAHMNLVQIPYAFLLGILIAYIYEKTKSILFPMLFHFMSNLFSVVLTYFKPAKVLYDSQIAFVLMVACSVAVVILTVLALHRVKEETHEVA